MHRLARTVLPLIAISLSATISRAQSFGNSGDVSFGADRLSGIYFFDEGPDFAVFALGAGPAYFSHPYTTPRLGLDFFVIDHLSIGGDSFAPLLGNLVQAAARHLENGKEARE